jgi:hypothetical protein
MSRLPCNLTSRKGVFAQRHGIEVRSFEEVFRMTIDLSTTVLTGLSLTAPGVAGDSLFGTVAVWADVQSHGTVTMAYSGSSPPYAPLALNPQWRSIDTPSVAIATDWDAVFVAFVDYDGALQLASSEDQWTTTQTISTGNVSAGPAIAYANDLLYIAWRTSAIGNMAFATRDRSGNVNVIPTTSILTSRPTICVDDPQRIYVLCGGALTSGPGPMLIYLSLDGGQTFNSVVTPAISCVGPPSLALLDQFYLAWADDASSRLHLAQTPNLSSPGYTTYDYDWWCHEGGPALIPVATIPDPNKPESWIFSLSTGWSIGSSDSNSHHVAVGSFGPLPLGSALVERERRKSERLRAPRAQDPCPDPDTVYDPANDECVAKHGCIGSCVLSSFTRAEGIGPVFNPVAYAWCILSCVLSEREKLRSASRV